MDLSLIKPMAIAKLKNNESIDSVAEEMEVSEALVREWYKELSPRDISGIETNVIATTTALQILSSGASDTADIHGQLYQVACKIAKNLENSHMDIELARVQNVNADTVAKLYNTFFGKAAIHLHSGSSGDNGSLADFTSGMTD